MKITFRPSNGLFGAALVVAALTAPAAHAEEIRLRIGSSHPLTYLPAQVLNSYFQEDVNRRLREAGSPNSITWREAYAGTMFKAADTLEAVRDGIVDITVVISLFEGELLPLSNVTYYTPFTGASLETMTMVMDDLMKGNVLLQEEWRANGLRYLAPVVLDSYHVWSTRALNSLGDLQGLKLNAPGVAATWLENTGAVGVDAPLTGFYTNVQTGVTAGSLSYFTGIVGTKLHEIAPHVTEANIGAQFTGAIAINPTTFDKLPADVQQAILETAEGYRDQLLQTTQARLVAARAEMVAAGATLAPMPDAQRQAWVEKLPNIPQRWIDDLQARGISGADVLLRDLYARLGAAGEPPFKAWIE